MPEELKPCPFLLCEGKPIIERTVFNIPAAKYHKLSDFLDNMITLYGPLEVECWIRCECGIETRVFDNEKSLIEFWNTRYGKDS